MKTEIHSRVVASAVVASLMLLATFLYFAPSTHAAATQVRRFGFGFVGIGSLIVAGYTAQEFFQGYFLTPPYPSTIQFLMNNGIQEISDTNDQAFLLSVMQMAQAYPNIKLGLDISFYAMPTGTDPKNPAQTGAQEWSEVQSFISMLGASPYKSSLGFVGIAQEQFFGFNSAATPAQMDSFFAQMNGYVTGAGFQFISYYPQGYNGNDKTSFLWMAHTNYPTGDTQNNLNDGSGTNWVVGQTIGSDGLQPFPSLGCPSISVYGTAMPAWSTQNFSEGYTGSGFSNPAPCHNPVTNNGYPPTLAQALAAAASLPAANRQWVMIIGGNNATGYGASSSCGCSYTYFTGVSGVNTHFMFDNPSFRATMSKWLNANPSIYITSNGPTPPTSSTSTTSIPPTTTTTTSGSNSSTGSTSQISSSYTQSNSSSSTLSNSVSSTQASSASSISSATTETISSSHTATTSGTTSLWADPQSLLWYLTGWVVFLSDITVVTLLIVRRSWFERDTPAPANRRRSTPDSRDSRRNRGFS